MAVVIGIIYDRDENWIAGSYYIENLIFAFTTLTQEKPILKIYSSSKSHFDGLKDKTNYPSLIWAELKDRNTFLDRLLNKISYILFKKHWIVRGMDSNVDILFPGSNSFFFEKIPAKLFWIPDFQERHYPEFFGKGELLKRRAFQKKLVKNKWPVVFSSLNAYSDFKELYPAARNKTFVIPFAVTLPYSQGINIGSLKEKFGIEGNYFICSNQFWRHKNHIVVLKAILELKKKGSEVNVVFTGAPSDPRNPGHYEMLREFVKENDLEMNTKFLGFIDRQEQLVLMQNCSAVIQPSLFEGWSTVVEDAKALGQPILVSDIPVHREQLGTDFTYYFRPDDYLKLSELMSKTSQYAKQNYGVYERNIKSFANRMLESMKEVLAETGSR
ncbi:MAG: glycosyltransferase family 4 protein [Bacteroidetes bacterium]|nr:glycosyltransferase family 4 protein [Bacteroidota bacterium]